MAALGSGDATIHTGNVVVPGDKVFELPEVGVLRVGTGLQDDGTHLVAVRPGILQQAAGNKLWVLGDQGRYIPSQNDPVVGIIVEKGSEYFTVDISAPFFALLPVLAFEGATRRNRPNLKEGDLFYARVETAHRDLQPTLSCMDSAGRASGFGPLKGGYVANCSVVFARALLAKPPPAALAALGRSVRFELAVGLNGRVWVNAGGPQADTILVARALEECQRAPPGKAEAVVVAMVKAHAAEGGLRRRREEEMMLD